MKNTDKILTNTKNYQCEGFSLIELSIVLIILGLLVAGVTGGASLIKSAKVNKMCNYISNIKQINDSYFEENNTVAGTNANGTWSASKAWDDFSTDNMIDSADIIGDNVAYCPGGKISDTKGCKDVAFFLVDSSGTQNLFSASDYPDDHFIKIGSTYSNLEIDATFASSIDKKLDDGHTTTGAIRGIKTSSTSGQGASLNNGLLEHIRDFSLLPKANALGAGGVVDFGGSSSGNGGSGNSNTSTSYESGNTYTLYILLSF